MPVVSSPDISPFNGGAAATGLRRVPFYLLKPVLILIGLAVLYRWAAVPATSLWHPGLFAGLLLSYVSFGLFGLRFQSSLTILGVRLRLYQSLKLNAFATFCQFFMPLSVGADLTRFALCRQIDPLHRAWRCASGIVVDHCTGLIAALALVITLSTPIFAVTPVLTKFAVPAFAGLVVTAVAAGWYLARSTRRSVLRVLNLLRVHRSRIVWGLALAFVMQATLAAAVYVGNVGWNLQLSYHEVLWVLACGSVVQLIPLNVAGVTVGDAAGTGLYLALGLALPDALRLVALFYVYRVSVAVIGGLWQLLPSSPKIRV